MGLEARNRSGVDQILTLEGYEVEQAETGQEALAVLDRQPFDIALIDYRLPDRDGLTLLLAIRKRKLDIMTCLITAYANIETAIAATRQGIDFFLPKPFSPEDLIGVTETLIRHKLLRKEAEELKKAHEASLLALASEKSQTHSLVTSLRDAVLVVNRNGEVVLANPAMGRLLRKEEDSLLRKPAAEVLAAEPFAPIRAALGRVTGENTVFEIEMGDQQSWLVSLPFIRREEKCRATSRRSRTYRRFAAWPWRSHVQRALLEREGVPFDPRGRIDLARYGWRPLGPR